ncbi:MAG TPA: uracil-DNA glycosylase, partial [Clostridiales bacterium]|nr:uracil-DNA glycosylase [Clostridiales bacterium]
MKKDELKKVYARCEEENTDPVIFGDGNPDASILLVGEAPGAKEIEQGKPFVGQAGKNLDDFLKILALEREDIYITNVVKFRPYRINEKTGKKVNRPPNKQEIEKHVKYLQEEIKIIQPKI